MKQLSFKAQCNISLAFIVCMFISDLFLEIGIVHNIVWIIIGGLFTINPVWPQSWDWKDHSQLKKGIRIGGILVIIIFGFLIRYGG